MKSGKDIVLRLKEKMGRPSTYTPEIAEEICNRLAGGQSLSAICKEDDMPCIAAVMNWLAKSEEGDVRFSGFVESYVRAREVQADVIFDECLEIADDSGADVIIDPETGLLKINGDGVQRAKLRIETRMRMAGKLRPKKYGDNKHVEVNNTGTVMHLTADLPRLSGIIRDVTARRNGIEIQGDVPDGSLLSAPIRTE